MILEKKNDDEPVEGQMDTVSVFSGSPLWPESNGQTGSMGSGEPNDTWSNNTEGFTLSIMNSTNDLSPVENSTAEWLRMVVLEWDRLLEEWEVEMMQVQKDYEDKIAMME